MYQATSVCEIRESRSRGSRKGRIKDWSSYQDELSRFGRFDSLGHFRAYGPGLRRPTCKVGFSRCKARARDAWHQAVCISKTQPCMSDQDSIIQRKFLPGSLLLLVFPPRAQQFASRKPTCAGPTQILLFYYFTILLFYYFTILLFYYFTILLFYYFTILLFYYFTILLFYYFTILLFYYFTILLFYYFTILLFYYFTILLFYYFTILLLLFYYFTILLFYYFTILLFYYFTILLLYYFTILLFYYFTILLFYYFTIFYFTIFYFTILLFYYFTILLFYYFTIILFYYFAILLYFYGKSRVCISKTHLCRLDPEITAFLISREIQRKFLPLFFFNRISSTGSAVCISKTHLCRSDPDFTILLLYNFTNFTRNREFASRNPPVPVGPRIDHFTDCVQNPEKNPPSLFTLIGFPPRPQQFASRKPTCAGPTQILLFYYFTMFTIFTISLFY